MTKIEGASVLRLAREVYATYSRDTARGVLEDILSDLRYGVDRVCGGCGWSGVDRRCGRCGRFTSVA